MCLSYPKSQAMPGTTASIIYVRNIYFSICINFNVFQVCSAQCRELDRVDFTHLLWTTLAEFPGKCFKRNCQ